MDYHNNNSCKKNKDLKNLLIYTSVAIRNTATTASQEYHRSASQFFSPERATSLHTPPQSPITERSKLTDNSDFN